MNHQNGVEVFCTAKNQPSIGMINSREDSVTSLRVPMIGGRNMNSSRNRPQARPEMEVSQYSWLFDRSKPIWLSIGAMADTKYHVAKR